MRERIVSHWQAVDAPNFLLIVPAHADALIITPGEPVFAEHFDGIANFTDQAEYGDDLAAYLDWRATEIHPRLKPGGRWLE